ncbi:MAG: type II secretion system F family protein [Hyphomicrobium sp.]|nr:type II secretion system F family protein [Hyphomicrobium sp.]
MFSSEMMPIFAALFAAAAFAAVVLTLVWPYLSGEKQKEKRVASVAAEQRVKKTGAGRSAADIAAQRKKQVTEALKDMETRAKKREKVTLRLRMERAGLEPDPKSFWIASAISSLVCTGLAFMFLPSGPLTNIGAIVAGFIGFLGLPRFILGKMIVRRQKKFTAELANSIDVIVRGVKSGLPLNECLQIISRESPEPIAGEFRYVVEQQRVGVPLAEALDRLINRMPLPEVKFLTIVIAIQQQAGGNLSEALGNLSGVLRDRFRMQMKVKALSAEAQSSAMVLASLPPGVMTMVYMSSPDYIAPLFNTTTGNLFIAGGLVWMSIGVFVMRKMINFKY